MENISQNVHKTTNYKLEVSVGRQLLVGIEILFADKQKE